MEYQAIYKCRLCGKEYVAGRIKGKVDALLFMTNSWRNASTIGQKPELFDIHCCHDRSYGVGDFQGLKYLEEEPQDGRI